MRFCALYTVPHVSVADCGHCNDGPPESVWNGFEEGLFLAGFGEVDDAAEQYDTWNSPGGAGAKRFVAHRLVKVGFDLCQRPHSQTTFFSFTNT